MNVSPHRRGRKEQEMPTGSDDLFDGQEDHATRNAKLIPSSLSSQDSFLSTDDQTSSSFSSLSYEISDDEEEDGLSRIPSFQEPQDEDSCNQLLTQDDEDEKDRETKEDKLTPEERSEALRYLVSMNTSLVTFPSCLDYLMEDRIAAHKLSGMKTAKMLTGLCWSLSRPEILSGPLITRQMMNVTDPHQHHNHRSLPQQQHITSSRQIQTPGRITSTQKAALDSVMIMQWNVLSQAIGYHCDKFATCSESDLTWSARKWKIIFEIAQYSPDILCLQEVDRFYFIHKMLQKIGYDGKFVPKPDSPCYHLPDNTGPDGCAIFYNTNRFILLKTTHRVLRVKGVQSNQVALLCHFKCKASGRVFAACTTHLKARKSPLLTAVRDEQGRDLLNFLDKECANGTPYIVTGDFNAEASEPVIQRMGSRLSSAYDDRFLTGYCPPSNWTQRMEEEEIKQTVDYIFYQKDKIRVSSVLDLYCPDLLTPLPNDQYPSDHLSLAARFTLMS